MPKKAKIVESKIESCVESLNIRADSVDSKVSIESTESIDSTKSIESVKTLDEIPHSLFALKTPPQRLFYKGNLNLLKNTKIAIVGTRNPNQYTRTMTAIFAKKLSRYATIVSGGALGIDIIAHTNALPNTIMVSPSSLDIIYPKENAKIIQNIMRDGLVLSEYEANYMPQKYSFLERNRIVIALSDIVILPQGDLKSGTSVSAKIALELDKPIFTLPHRYNESKLTNKLLAENKARAIYDIDTFIDENLKTLFTSWDCADYTKNPDINYADSARDSIDSINFTDSTDSAQNAQNDEILAFCANAPSFEDAFKKFGAKLLEYEFLGLLVRENSTIRTK